MNPGKKGREEEKSPRGRIVPDETSTTSTHTNEDERRDEGKRGEKRAPQCPHMGGANARLLTLKNVISAKDKHTQTEASPYSATEASQDEKYRPPGEGRRAGEGTPVAATFWVNASRAFPLLTTASVKNPCIFILILKKKKKKLFVCFFFLKKKKRNKKKEKKKKGQTRKKTIKEKEQKQGQKKKKRKREKNSKEKRKNTKKNKKIERKKNTKKKSKNSEKKKRKKRKKKKDKTKKQKNRKTKKTIRQKKKL